MQRHKHLLIALWMAAVAAKVDAADLRHYVSPAGGNLVVLAGEAPGEAYHGSTDQVKGTVYPDRDHPRIVVQIDIRSLHHPDSHATGRFERFIDPVSRGELTIQIDRLSSWPASILDEPTVLQGWGSLGLGGAVAPLDAQVDLGWGRLDSNGELAGYTVKVHTRLRPGELGIELPDWAAPLLGDLDLELVLDVRPYPYLVVSGDYNWMRGASFTRARELGYGEIDEGFFVLAAIQNDDVRNTLHGMGVPVDSLAALLDAGLEAARPDTAARRRRWSQASYELVNRRAHQEAYRLGSELVEPVHLLLSACRTIEHWSHGVLDAQGVTAEALLVALTVAPPQARSVRRLGNPFHQARRDSVALRYACNVWDMHLWDGRIYLGHGNSSNLGPAVNAGPVDVVSYALEEDGWQKVRSIPEGVHAYGMRGFRDSLFAALGTTMGGVVARSGDGGQTWESLPATAVSRVFELFAVHGELCGYGYRPEGRLLRYSGEAFAPVSVDPFAGVSHTKNAMLVRTVPFGSELLYIGADNVNDHQWIPSAAFHALRIDEPRRVGLPHGFLPYDIVVQDDVAYLLANCRNAEDKGYAAAVFATSDPQLWEEIVRVELPTFARSFERCNGRFYLGLGTDVAPLAEASGDVYEITPP